MTSIRDTIAAMDEEHKEWEEINGEDGDHSVKQYEDHEDTILDFADTAESWIRTALEVLTPKQIDAVDARCWIVPEPVAHTWPAHEFDACRDNEDHLLSSRHRRAECPMGEPEDAES